MNQFDVVNLENQFQNLGNTFDKRRQEEERKRKDIANELMRQQMYKLQQDRAAAATAHETRMESKADDANNLAGEGKVDAWLQGDDGGTFHFNGPQSGYDKLMQGSQAKGKTLKVLSEPPTAKPQYGTFKTETPLGEMEFHLSSPEDVDKVAEAAKKLGGQTPSKTGMSSRGADLEKAMKYRKEADAETDPMKKEMLLNYAEDLESGAKPATVTSVNRTGADPNTGAFKETRTTTTKPRPAAGNRGAPLKADPLTGLPPKVSIPPAAAAYLKQNPSTRELFDKKYGAGSAASILGK